MKKVLIASILFVGLATTGVVYAYDHGMGNHPMMGSGMMDGNDGEFYCPGAAGSGSNEWKSEKNQKFLTDTVELRKKMNDKRFEYMEAQRNPETTTEQLSMIEQDMIGLQAKIHDAAEQNR